MPSAEPDRSKLTVEEIARRFHGDMIPLGNKFSYFTAMPVPEEDLKQYLEDPIAALPPAICKALPAVEIILVPFLEKNNGKGADSVAFEKPHDHRHVAASRTMGDEAVSDYHYCFYSAIAALVAGSLAAGPREQFFRVLREELATEVHGEVDER